MHPHRLSLPCHSVGSPPNCLDKGLPVRTWRLRGLSSKIRGLNQDKSDRVVLCTAWSARARITTAGVWLKCHRTLLQTHRERDVERPKRWPPSPTPRGTKEMITPGLIYLRVISLSVFEAPAGEIVYHLVDVEDHSKAQIQVRSGRRCLSLRSGWHVSQRLMPLLCGAAAAARGGDWLHRRGPSGGRSRRRDCPFCWHPLPIYIETPTKGRGGCSRMTVSPTARRRCHVELAAHLRDGHG